MAKKSGRFGKYGDQKRKEKLKPSKGFDTQNTTRQNSCRKVSPGRSTGRRGR